MIPVLLEKLDMDSLPRELQMYMRTHTYIDATDEANDLERIHKRIRFGMPGTKIGMEC